MAVTVKNFIYNGKLTNLYYVVDTILTYDNYCQRKYLDEMFDDWHYFRNIQLKLGKDLINTKEGNKSYFSISPDLYETYVDAMWSINKQPIRWTDIPKKVEPKDDVHYVHYDMEVESMDMKTAKQILNENGFLLEDTNTKSLVGKFWAAKKAGDTLSKEDAEALLNAPDFDDVVNPKYKNYILSVCRKVAGVAGVAPKPKTLQYNFDDNVSYKSYWPMIFSLKLSKKNPDYNGKNGVCTGKPIVFNIDDKEEIKNFIGEENYNELFGLIDEAISKDPDHIYIKKYKGKWITNDWLHMRRSELRNKVNLIDRAVFNTLNDYQYMEKGNYHWEPENLRWYKCTDGEEYHPQLKLETDDSQLEPDDSAAETRSDAALRRYGHSH